MTIWRHVAVHVLVVASLVTTGCGLSSYMTARKSPRDLKYESDTNLCAAKRHWHTPQLMNEINRRRLNCVTGTREPIRDRSATARTTRTEKSPGGSLDSQKQPKGREVSEYGSGVDLDAFDPAPAAEGGEGRDVREPTPVTRGEGSVVAPSRGGVDLDR